jgi:hypothetical protein
VAFFYWFLNVSDHFPNEKCHKWWHASPFSDTPCHGSRPRRTYILFNEEKKTWRPSKPIWQCVKTLYPWWTSK